MAETTLANRSPPLFIEIMRKAFSIHDHATRINIETTDNQRLVPKFFKGLCDETCRDEVRHDAGFRSKKDDECLRARSDQVRKASDIGSALRRRRNGIASASRQRRRARPDEQEP